MGNYKSSNNIAVGSHGADDSVMATLSPKNWVKEYLIMLGWHGMSIPPMFHMTMGPWIQDWAQGKSIFIFLSLR